MPSGRGVAISVTAETDTGERMHMEDYLDVRLTPNSTLQEIPALREQCFVGVFDGHGGREAARYARERLWDLIQQQSKFRTTDRQKVVEAIKEAHLGLHIEMEPMRPSWELNELGDLSTAGTTACTVIFRHDHFYVANVGDSSAVSATVNERAEEEGQPALVATKLTRDHRAADPSERERVERLGGQVKLNRKGEARVVWERKKLSDDPDKPPTVDFIPCLSVSRSLGDFWSWNEHTQQFVVSPQPDVHIHPLDPSRQRFLVLASDGLWDVMSPQEVVDFVWAYETRDMEDELLHQRRDVVRALINEALYRWRREGMLADNIAVVIAFLSQDGTPALGSSLTGSPQYIESRTGRHVHGTHAEATVYRRETLPGRAIIDGYTIISPWEEPGGAIKEQEGRSPLKRSRESVLQPPPPSPKKSQREGDSG